MAGSHCDPVGPKVVDVWLSISDKHVHPVELREVLSCEATLLLYQRKQNS